MAGTVNIDDEWSNFISNTNRYDAYSSDDDEINDEIQDNDYESLEHSDSPPEPTDIYISTKSIIVYLNQPVDLKIFWDIKVMPYATPTNGVIKKQIKIDTKSPDELKSIKEKLKNENYYEEIVKTHIDNPNGRIKFRDTRKISIGISKKDIECYRAKQKEAFLNCFVLRIRLKIDNLFREFHVKIFNTGKIEIPGVQNDDVLVELMEYTLSILQPFYLEKLDYDKQNVNVLINSNFNCRFYVDREALFDILKDKYNIEAIYDPCTYPGVQCRFYYDTTATEQTGVNKSGIQKTKTTKAIKKENKEKEKHISGISFMIFRTGSVLIVGRCDENALVVVYKFLTDLFKREYKHICKRNMTDEEIVDKDNKKNKPKKPRRKTIMIMNSSVEETNDVNEINETNETNDVNEISDVNDEDIIELLQDDSIVELKPKRGRKKKEVSHDLTNKNTKSKKTKVKTTN